MIEATHTKHAPWTVVKTNDKRRGRLEVLRHILQRCDFPSKDEKVIGTADPKIIGTGPEALDK